MIELVVCGFVVVVASTYRRLDNYNACPLHCNIFASYDGTVGRALPVVVYNHHFHCPNDDDVDDIYCDDGASFNAVSGLFVTNAVVGIVSL